MLFIFSDISDFSSFFFLFYNEHFILENTYTTIEISEQRLKYITLKWKLLHVNSYFYLYFINLFAFTSVVSLRLVRRFFILNKFYFFYRKEIPSWVMHISIRVVLYILFIPICTVYYICKMIRYRFLDFILLSFFCILFSAFFMLWYSAWGVFFIMLTFAIHGFITILWLDLEVKIFYIKKYWKPLFKKMHKIAAIMHIEAIRKNKRFLNKTKKNYRIYLSYRIKSKTLRSRKKLKNLEIVKSHYFPKSRYYYHDNYW